MRSFIKDLKLIRFVCNSYSKFYIYPQKRPEIDFKKNLHIDFKGKNEDTQ